MITRALGFALIAACGLGSTAHAADLTYEEQVVIVDAPAFNWTGFYAGVHAGYGWADVKNPLVDNGIYGDAFNGGDKPDGFFGGAQIGYNQQFSNRVVLGIEADAAFADLKDSGQAISGDLDGDFYRYNAKTEINALGTVRARLGYAADRFLPYVTGGLAWANTKYSFDFDTSSPFLFGNYSDSQLYTGWTVGAGLEYAVTSHVTAKIEYLYADLGSKNFDVPEFGQTSVDLSSLQTVKFGLNYKF